MERLTRDEGVETARLVSTATAQRFYAASGWAEAGPPQSECGMPGYPMKKRLDGANPDAL